MLEFFPLASCFAWIPHKFSYEIPDESTSESTKMVCGLSGHRPMPSGAFGLIRQNSHPNPKSLASPFVHAINR